MSTKFDAIDMLSRYETPLLKDMEAGDDVLEWVAAYVGSEDFLDEVDDFCDKHGPAFATLLTKGGPSSEELDAIEPHWKQLHQEFVTSSMDRIKGFLEKHGFTMEEYEKRCEEEQKISADRQRHTRMSFFVQILQACCEYDQFLNLMRRAADPEFYDKRMLQYEAESILQDANEHLDIQESQALNSKRAASAQEFITYLQENSNLSLDELTQEFQKRMHL